MKYENLKLKDELAKTKFDAVKITLSYSSAAYSGKARTPKVTAISKLTKGKKQFTVKWKKQSLQTTGYQIKYSTSSKFSKAKTVTVNKNTTVSKTVKKLKAHKKYYVKVRTYKKTSDGTIYYSNWSGYKTVKTR